ncbi:MAG TPA: hypothetical protein VGS06_21090 [Streptosporangiaceae bacterium]|nr:hypothetical protein [Streptosporangiaceae bacterium]
MTVIIRPAIGGPVVGTADDTTGVALWLDAGELAVDELADGVPAEHAATDRPAAQLAAISAIERYVFIAFLYSVQQ